MRKANEIKTIPVTVRLKPDEKKKLDLLAETLSEQLGVEITRTQAFNLAVREVLIARGITQ